MKLLALISPGYPVFGGAQLSTVTLLQRLRREFGWDVRYATRHHERVRTRYRGIPVETYRDPDELCALVARERPDVSLGALDSVPDGLRAARRFGVPTIVSLVSFEYCPPTPDEIGAWGVSTQRLYPSEAEREWAFSEAALLVSNSQFLRDRVRERSGVDSTILYPELDESEFLPVSGRRPEAIVGVCGHRYKGADIFVALADAFPEHRFHLAGDVDPALREMFRLRPNIRILGRVPSPRMFAGAKVVLVPSQWPEPFGRVAVEAMACDVPMLASRVGGLREIVGDSVAGVEDFREPGAWIEALSPLLSSDVYRRECAELGRARAAPFLCGDSTRQFARDAEACARSSMPDFATPVVAVCGGTHRKTAFSSVNRHWVSELSKRSEVRVLDVEDSADLSRDLPDVTIWHDLSEDFSTAEFPDAGRLVVCRTWDFGPYPPEWAQRAREEADLLAVYSRFVRAHAVGSGLAPGRVTVAGLGFDEAVFQPMGPPLELRTAKRFRFLFTGAPIVRKGADVLLEAYCRAFGPKDDVCLVIKDHPSDVFYEGQKLRDRIHAAEKDPNGPEVEYICEFLPPKELAALYRSCDVGVFPYRAEGFAMPILEMMAAGVPSIVPRFGAALDYCSDRTSFLMPVRRISLPVDETFAINTLGARAKVDEVEFCEASVDALVDVLREVAKMAPEEIAARGRRGAETAHRRYRWQDVSQPFFDRVLKLKGGTPRRSRRRRQEQRAAQRRLEVARDLFLEEDG